MTFIFRLRLSTIYIVVAEQVLKTRVRNNSFDIFFLVICQINTLEKLKVFGQLNPLEKCFKICYVYGKRKPIDQGILKGKKFKVALNEKRKKLHGFSFSINIANFEAFL